jgi:PAS domain S-box-containing protein
MDETRSDVKEPIASNRPPRILNVDDNDGARYVKTRVLRQAGFEVIEAASGRDALDKARTEKPELVLLDVKLPDINGLEVCRRLKSAPDTSAILVLQTSASLIESVHRVKALDAGADSFLVEPIEAEELVANVKALLRLRRAEEAHREVQSALGESEARFRQLAEAVGDVFWIVGTAERRFLYVSPAYARQWQRDERRLLADARSWFEAMHADDRERMHERFLRLAESDGYEEEYRVLGATGEERWVAERAFPIRDAQGRHFRFAGISQDVTLRKRAELLLIEADRRKDEFLAMLSHELRSPLAPIKSAVDILSLERPDAGSSARAIGIIGRQVDHLARLVDDLLDVARINRGKISLDIAPVELRAVLTSAIETVRPMLEFKRHETELSLPAGPLYVNGDAVRLAQVFGNLLNNAAKFTEPGGRIGIEAERHGSHVEVHVSDNGAGIAPEVRSQVFDLFTQADHALDRSQGGLGIGLSLVKSIVALHGGEVWAESAGLGAGSRFTVRLPLGAAPAAAAAVDVTPNPSRSRVLRVLVVDDNADSVDAMAMLLESLGHRVETATRGDTALEKAAASWPEVVLLDIGLPGMSGYDVARALRAMPFPAPPVLIAISGYGRDSDRALAGEAGFDHHLVKPADPQALFEIIGAL